VVKCHCPDTIALWDEVCLYRDATGENTYKGLAEFAQRILCMPHSNAEIERVFSRMNIVKSKLRNSMSVELLNAILTIRSGLHRDIKACCDYEISKVVTSLIGTSLVYNDNNWTAETCVNVYDNCDCLFVEMEQVSDLHIFLSCFGYFLDFILASVWFIFVFSDSSTVYFRETKLLTLSTRPSGTFVQPRFLSCCFLWVRYGVKTD